MELSSKTESFKRHSYTIVTTVFIALLTFGYVSYILPKNEAKEDIKNTTILKGIEKQLNAYIDDQVKYISEEKMIGLNLKSYKGSTGIHIDTITIDNSGFKQLQDGTIKLSRTIKLSVTDKIKYKNLTEKDLIIRDSITIDLVKFLNKINSTTLFTSFYICPIEDGKCQVDKSFLSQNVSLIDQDSLISNNRKNGPFSFKKSTKHYYTNQIIIPHTNHTLFLAAGVDNSYFKTSVRQIDSSLLIFSFILIIALVLGINFIKPIISSYNERLSQIDLVGVVFSIGILIAVLVVFGVLSFWNHTVKERTTKDLKDLVESIDTSFSKQIVEYQNWRKNLIFEEKWKNKKNEYVKIYLKRGVDSTSFNGEPLTKADTLLDKDQKFGIPDKPDVIQDRKLVKYFDGYFRMDNKGLLTTYLNNTFPDIPRKYSDRMYFKMLQPEKKGNQNQNIETFLTAVFSREDNKYQWIYAEKDLRDQKNQIEEKNGIKGTAFREYFSDDIKLPPGTSYMLIDRYGDVLMQNDPEKNLYQNLLYGSQNNPKLISLLSGIIPQSFEMEYQGKPYQIYAKKLSTKIDSPVYILGIRDLSHLNRLLIYTFSNGLLISVLYGFFLLLINYIYSIVFYSGRLSVFSNRHFYYLFPNNSRTYEYRLLAIVNSISILLAIMMSFFSTPSIAFVFGALLGINLAIINLIMLNIHTLKPKLELIKLVVILSFFGISMPSILFYTDNLWLAIFALFSTHIALVLYYKNWRKRQNVNLTEFAEKNAGVNRKAFTLFLTARILYQYVAFPFVLISAFYVSEINDFARYYCSSKIVTEETKRDNVKPKYINAYDCSCNNLRQPLLTSDRKDHVLQEANLGFLDRPALYEIKNFTFNKLAGTYYLNSMAFVQKENIFCFLLIAFTLFFGLVFLAYQLLNYYSNRFFLYDLMQAGYKGYYPCKKNQLADDYIFIDMVNNDDVKELIQKPINKTTTSDIKLENKIEDCPDRKIGIDEVFDSDKNNEISPFLRMDFILNYNNKYFGTDYNTMWDALPDDETRYVLFDFAQDHFVNYKNKDTLISLMECGIIDCHQLTGRLKMVSLSFRIFILSKSKRDVSFIKNFKDESKNGTFSKLKFPMLIIAISALILLMYLNKDGYDRVAVMGGSIVSVLALINKFLDINKNL